MSGTPAAVVRLLLGSARSEVLVSSADGRRHALTLALGLDNVRPGPLRSEPPSAMELEAAIEYVENVVMPLARQLPSGALLHVEGELPPGVEALRSIEEIEARFNEIVAVAHGRPAGRSGLADRRHASAVLILREWMHHLGFAAIGRGD